MLQGRLPSGGRAAQWFQSPLLLLSEFIRESRVLWAWVNGDPIDRHLVVSIKEVVVLHTFHGSTDKSLKVCLNWNLLAVAYHPLGSFKWLLPRIWSIEMPGSTKLARPSFTETRSGGILVLIPGSWVVICRISLMFLRAWRKRSMLFWAWNVRIFVSIWLRSWLFSSSRCCIGRSISEATWWKIMVILYYRNIG